MKAMRYTLTGLFLIMFTLKLLGLTDLSWWIITLPLWGFTALMLSMALVAIVLYCIISVFASKEDKSRRELKDFFRIKISNR